MARPLRIFTLACCLALLAASPGLSGMRDEARPPRYLSAVLDGRPATVVNPVDGRTWMATLGDELVRS